MQSLTICARLMARAICGTEAESVLYHSILRLSTQSSLHYIQPQRIASLPGIKRGCVHLVTASSGYSGHHKTDTTIINESTKDLKCLDVYGDDAFFITKHRIGDFLGVADGVGGWREHGIDPSIFSSSLMDACKTLIDKKLIDLGPLTLKELLSMGYKQLLENKQCIVGSSTACIVALHKEKSILHTANLGDSGFVIIRKNQIVHRSQEQQHYFNSPFQLAIHPTLSDPLLIADSPDLASVSSFDVKENDFILVGTDGVWDNLPDTAILNEIIKIKKPNLENLQKAAHAISKRALENGFDPHYMSPFARSARRSLGINITGGKPDDVTVLLAVVVMS